MNVFRVPAMQREGRADISVWECCRARREAVLKQATEGPDATGEYTGMNNYVDYNKGFRREHTIGSEKGSGTETSECLFAWHAWPRLTAHPLCSCQ